MVFWDVVNIDKLGFIVFYVFNDNMLGMIVLCVVNIDKWRLYCNSFICCYYWYVRNDSFYVLLILISKEW